ncbi:MAG: DegT/DnrJ/EryC1/StrS family aminotransferase [Planctomycetaceae bacterium]|nr:DegT/DnrJ/EryC1/StrS family aminotransferase [Planctomycetaceae bacterium]
MIPLADCQRQYLELQAQLDAAISTVTCEGIYLGGEQTARFEQEFAEYCGAKHVVAVANGTDALELAMRAAGCQAGTEVVTVANAGMYSTVAAIQTGATPVFVDIDEQTLLMSIRALEEAITSATRVVVATHLYGKLVDVDAIRNVIGNREVVVLEDCAQAHGAGNVHGRAGSQGDLAAFSFYPTKNLSALGDAGVIAVKSDEWADRVRCLSQYGWKQRFHAVLSHGRNSRMDELQAAVLRVKLPLLDRANRLRRELVTRYWQSANRNHGELQIVHGPDADRDSDDFVAHLCIARHPQRDGICAALAEDGVATSIHYPVPDHQQLALQHVPWRAGSLAVTEAVAGEVFSLPCFPQLTDEEVHTVCQSLQRIA